MEYFIAPRIIADVWPVCLRHRAAAQTNDRNMQEIPSHFIETDFPSIPYSNSEAAKPALRVRRSRFIAPRTMARGSVILSWALSAPPLGYSD